MKVLFEDSDEKVRAAVVEAFLHMDFEIACHRASTAILNTLGDRADDKKVS